MQKAGRNTVLSYRFLPLKPYVNVNVGFGPHSPLVVVTQSCFQEVAEKI